MTRPLSPIRRHRPLPAAVVVLALSPLAFATGWSAGVVLEASGLWVRPWLAVDHPPAAVAGATTGDPPVPPLVVTPPAHPRPVDTEELAMTDRIQPAPAPRRTAGVSSRALPDEPAPAVDDPPPTSTPAPPAVPDVPPTDERPTATPTPAPPAVPDVPPTDERPTATPAPEPKGAGLP